jgi:hypothetical protein
MEIEFNTGSISQADVSQPSPRPSVTRPAPDPVSFTSFDSLKSQLSQISSVRPEQVARAKALVADENYPSDDVLNQVADHLTNSSEGNSTSG